MKSDLPPNQSASKEIRWLGLELFSVWRRAMPKPTVINPETMRELLAIAANEDRTFDGCRIEDVAAECPQEELRRRVESLITSSNQLPNNSFDLPGLKEHGLRVDDFLGKGAMGVVYRCWQYNPGRYVAVKFIAPNALHEARDDLETRFAAEARILGKLNHECIAHVYLGGSVRDWSGNLLSFVAMEMVDGGALHDVFRTPSDSLQCTIQRFTVFQEICAAVQYAHEQDVFHRDIKPSNILVQEMSTRPLKLRPKLVDFGLARLVAGAALSAPLGPSGTSGYRSPSILRGDESNPARADIFSLGILLYRLLCGNEPQGLRSGDFAHLDGIPDPTARYAAEAAQVDGQLVAGLRLPESVGPAWLRLDLESIINRAVRVGETSYVNVSEISIDLARLLSSDTVTAPHRNTKLLRASRWTAKHRSLVAASVLAVLLLVGGGIWYAVGRVAANRLRVAQADRLLRPVGQEPGAFSDAEMLALREIAAEDQAQIRVLFFERAFASPTSARQFRNRAVEIEKNAIRLNAELRSKVHAMLMHRLRSASASPNTLEERIACVPLGMALHSQALSDGDEFAYLAIDAILDGIHENKVLVNDVHPDLDSLARNYKGNVTIMHDGDAFDRGVSLLDQPASIILSLAPNLTSVHATELAVKFPSLAESIASHDLVSVCQAFAAVLSRVEDDATSAALSQRMLDTLIKRVSNKSYHEIQHFPDAFRELRQTLSAEQAAAAARAIAQLPQSGEDEPSDALLGIVRLLSALSPTETTEYVEKLASLIPVADDFAISLLDNERSLAPIPDLSAAEADQLAAAASQRLVRTFEEKGGYYNRLARNLSNLLIALAPRLSDQGQARVRADLQQALPHANDRLFGLAQVCKALAASQKPEHSAELADACGRQARKLLQPLSWPSATGLVADLGDLIPIQSREERVLSVDALRVMIPHCQHYDLPYIVKALPGLEARGDVEIVDALKSALMERIKSLATTTINSGRLPEVIEAMANHGTTKATLTATANVLAENLSTQFTEANAIEMDHRLENVAILWPWLAEAQRDKWREAAANRILRLSGGTVTISPRAEVLFSADLAAQGVQLLCDRWRKEDRLSMMPQELRSLEVLALRIEPKAATRMATALLDDIRRAHWVKRQLLLKAFAAIVERLEFQDVVELYWRPDCTGDAMPVLVRAMGRQSKTTVRGTSIWPLVANSSDEWNNVSPPVK